MKILTLSQSKEIVSELRGIAKRLGTKLVFDHQNEYLDGDTTAGSEAYFCHEPTPVAKVSTKGRLPSAWLANACHELSHADQYARGTMEWRYCFIDGVPVETLAGLWIDGHIELDKTQKNRVFDSIYRVELYAERKAIHMMDRVGLLEYVDPCRYAQEAWAYVLTYKYAKYHRKWVPASKVQNERLISLMPVTLGMSPNYYITENMYDT